VTFARHGHAPTTTQLADQIAAPVDDVRRGLQQLAAPGTSSLSDAGDIVMAHPFSAIPLGFSVMGTDTLWWGGCARDSFAMPHLLTTEPALLVATTCPCCSTPHAWNLIRAAPPPGDQIAHFLALTAHMWDDVVHTCGHLADLLQRDLPHAWLQRTGNARGYAMDLPTLWNFASGLVHRPTRPRLHEARPGPSRGLPPRRRPVRPLLGAVNGTPRTLPQQKRGRGPRAGLHDCSRPTTS
jgi:hypothetical protein